MSNVDDPAARVLRLARERGILRARDLAPFDLPRAYLSRMVGQGRLVRLERGLYGLPDHRPGERHSLALVGRRVAGGTVCLLSALQYHGLTTQAPWEVWLGIEYGGRTPRPGYPPLRVVRYSEASFAVGAEDHLIEGVRVRVFGVAKTLADCFKYRRHVGLDVALEALKQGWQGRRFKADELLGYARVNRVARVIRPYLEAVVA